MLIKNKTSLAYEDVGKIIDRLIKSSEGNTFYFGKKESVYVSYNKKKYKLSITYLKKYTKLILEEVNNG